MTRQFTRENTAGYTDVQLAELNAEWDAIQQSRNINWDDAEWKHFAERLLRDFDQRHPIVD